MNHITNLATTFARRSFVVIAAAALISGFFIPLSANAAITSLNLTSPDGTEMWRGMRDITWTTATDINGGNDLSLLISNDGGSTYTTLVGVIPFTPGTYSWNTIPTIDGNLYKIRVHNPATGAFDSSTSDFRVDNTPPHHKHHDSGSDRSR